MIGVGIRGEPILEHALGALIYRASRQIVVNFALAVLGVNFLVGGRLYAQFFPSPALRLYEFTSLR